MCLKSAVLSMFSNKFHRVQNLETDGIQEVSGSIPLISTIENHTVNRLVCGVFLCFWVNSKLFAQNWFLPKNYKMGICQLNLSTNCDIGGKKAWFIGINYNRKNAQRLPDGFPFIKEKLTLCRMHYANIFFSSPIPLNRLPSIQPTQ